MSKQSIQAFIDAINNGQLVSNQHRVYHHLMIHGKCNLDELRMRIKGMPHQSLTSALSHLHDKGWIWQNDGGYFMCTDAANIDLIAKLRETRRYEKWVKAGLKNGWFARQFQEDMDREYAKSCEAETKDVCGIDDNGQMHLL